MSEKTSPDPANILDDYQLVRDRLHDQMANAPMSAIQILVVTMCFVLNMIDGMDVLIVSFTSSHLESELALSKSELGYIFSAGLFGMMVGCIFIAPVADRIGRAKTLLLSTVFITFGMLLTAIINAYDQILLLRFITGLGIGGILPTMATITSEFANEKRRNFSVGLVQAGWPAGAILTGLFVAWAVPIYGWRVSYLTAGVISAVMLPFIYLYIPESIDFLLRKQPKNALQQINKILQKMGHEKIKNLPEKPAHINDKITIGSLFNPALKYSTILLWAGIFFAFMTLYTLISWIPNIAQSTGMPFALSTYAGMALNVGAFIGTVGIGWLSMWLGLNRLIFIFMTCGFIFMSIYANLSLGYPVMFALILLIGISAQGGITGFYPAATRIYPMKIRATGIGWAMGIGRTGAIIGPALFGIFFDAGYSIQNLFIIFSIPLMLAGFFAFLIPSDRIK